ncbi:hypothetical protein PVAND_014970 [Polypedilum vanderplanki]|uniref:alkaline phosphatase n=1 Tax=Polypedilum vanderplanki TaxID=319348 RepID=A0A9J6BBJ3_POLVA|nr:hypothetical protein PVAND_014970 [Polypedilum vanderplanki]
MKFVIFFSTLVLYVLATPRKYHYVPTEQFQSDDVPDNEMHPDFHDDEEFMNKKFKAIRAEELTKEFWMEQGKDFIEQQLSKYPNTKRAKNILFFLGDGMGHSTVAAARMAMGNENMQLKFEEFPWVASSKTFCVDEQTADSACSATAYLSGVKGNSMTIGVNGNMKYMDCEDTGNRNKYTESIAKWAQDAGKATGVVTTTRITHASPAGVYAHTASRYWEDDYEIIVDRCDPNTIDDIALQLIHGEVGHNLNVIFGGGSRGFIPQGTQENGYNGRRRDGRNLINEWLEAKANRTFVNNRERLMEVTAENLSGDVFGLFHGSHMSYNIDRTRLNRENLEPSLAEMTTKAIELLSTNENGFFLFVEGGRIDHGHHETMAQYAVDETIQFHRAIEAALELVDIEETIVIVTADHSHVFTYAGYPHRGNNIFGLSPSGTQDGMPFFTLSYANGPGFYEHRQNGARVDPRTIDITDPELEYPALVPLSSETHAAEDVGIYAIGPWAHLYRGTIEQSFIPHVLAYASCIGPNRRACDDNPNLS